MPLAGEKCSVPVVFNSSSAFYQAALFCVQFSSRAPVLCLYSRVYNRCSTALALEDSAELQGQGQGQMSLLVAT